MAESEENFVEFHNEDTMDYLLEILPEHVGHKGLSGEDSMVAPRFHPPIFQTLRNNNLFDTSDSPAVIRWGNREEKTSSSVNSKQVTEPWAEVRRNPSEDHAKSGKIYPRHKDSLGSNVPDVTAFQDSCDSSVPDVTDLQSVFSNGPDATDFQNILSSNVLDMNGLQDILSNNVPHEVDSGMQLITNPAPIGSNFRHQPNEKKALVDDSDDEDHSHDVKGWKEKPILLWDENDTKKWLWEASIAIGQLYREISPEIARPGKDLLDLTREDWLLHDKKFGPLLYDYLCKLRHRLGGSRTALPTEVPHIDANVRDEILHESDSPSTDEDSDKETPPKPTGTTGKTTGRPPGRPPKIKEPKEPKPKIWEFIRDLLLDPSTCPSWIRWDKYEEKTFIFVESQKVAQRWGNRRDNDDMNFEKFSRLMRYYYKKKCLEPVAGRRLVYKFGPNATGLETSNPNFEHGPTVDLDLFTRSFTSPWQS